MPILRMLKGFQEEVMRKVRCSRLQHNLPFILCHLWTMLCPLWMDRPLWYLRRPSIPLWNSGSIYVGGLQRTSGPNFLNSTQHPTGDEPASPGPHHSVRECSVGGPFQCCYRWLAAVGLPPLLPPFFPSAHGSLDPLEGGRKEGEGGQ